MAALCASFHGGASSISVPPSQSEPSHHSYVPAFCVLPLGKQNDSKGSKSSAVSALVIAQTYRRQMLSGTSTLPHLQIST